MSCSWLGLLEAKVDSLGDPSLLSCNKAPSASGSQWEAQDDFQWRRAGTFQMHKEEHQLSLPSLS